MGLEVVVAQMISSVPIILGVWDNIMDVLIDVLGGFVDGLFRGFFLSCYDAGIAFWNAMISLSIYTVQKTPLGFSSSAYLFVMYTLHDWLYGIGATMLNVMFYVGLVRSASNLRQNITLEVVIEALIKVVAANLLLQFGRTIIQNVNNIANGMTSELVSMDSSSYTITAIATEDIDAGSLLFCMFLGIIFLVVAAVSACTIFLTVYTRYLELYMLIAAYPIAIPTIAGGQGISQTAAAWAKTYLAKIFASVVIVLIIILSGKIMSNFSLSDDSGVLASFLDCICNMLTMVVVAGAVKGTDTFLRRTFAL